MKIKITINGTEKQLEDYFNLRKFAPSSIFKMEKILSKNNGKKMICDSCYMTSEGCDIYPREITLNFINDNR